MIVHVAPPEQIDAGPVVLRRNTSSRAQSVAIARAVRESLEHLRPWMPWATPEAATVAAQARRGREVAEGWRRGTDFVYLICPPDSGRRFAAKPQVIGIIGLHQRVGPDSLEIGYWTHVDHAGRGYMTAAAKALTEAAENLPGIGRLEIHTDEANVRSAAIPQKLGYRLDRIDVRDPQAPGESGRLQIWVRP